jgi:hypothetical protein
MTWIFVHPYLFSIFVVLAILLLAAWMEAFFKYLNAREVRRMAEVIHKQPAITVTVPEVPVGQQN